MPDVTMCDSSRCPLAKVCYYNPRSGTKPDKYRQSFFILGAEASPPETDDCTYYVPRDARMKIAHDGSVP